ncbi:MAG: zf-HC2 domain-containing protein [Gorillibacterium sp.]|nr:zf-HC2 domain-containing protein [Gorillibacterium sp.]
MNCEEALHHMHEYLDGDLNHVETVTLKKHMLTCPECNRFFRELEMTEALIKNTTSEPTPEGLTERIINSLPVRPKRQSWFQWVRRHPAISVASVFLFVMLGSFLTMWNQDLELTVKGSNLDQLIIGDDTVYLPIGNHVAGNLMVRGGNVKIDGQLDGNLVIVDGSFQTASTANISGKIYEINQAAEWLVYQMKEIFIPAAQ